MEAQNYLKKNLLKETLGGTQRTQPQLAHGWKILEMKTQRNMQNTKDFQWA